MMDIYKKNLTVPDHNTLHVETGIKGKNDSSI